METIARGSRAPLTLLNGTPARTADDRELLTAAETAQRLKLKNPRTLANWRSSGKGPPWTSAGGRILYRVADLELWLEERRRVPFQP